MTRLTLALAQTNARLGDLNSNLEKHLQFIDDAQRSDADLILFPELSMTGYLLQDITTDVACRPEKNDPTFGPLLEASRTIDVLLGFVEEDERHRFYISAAYLSQGEIVHIHRKVYLPTYGLFDEGRFFAQGNRIRAFDTRLGRFGVLICEDFWHASPPYLLWLDGADVMLFISASPGRGPDQGEKLGTTRWVERILQAYASLFTTFVAHTNRVGFEDGLHFRGGATVFDPDGQRIATGPYQQEALTLAEVDLQQLRRTRSRLPLLRDERIAIVHHELSRMLREENQGAA
jgi:predicted amidohydrolase